MPRYLFERTVRQASGTQTFCVDADTEEEALTKARAGEGDIVSDNTEVTRLGEPEIVGTTDKDVADEASCIPGADSTALVAANAEVERLTQALKDIAFSGRTKTGMKEMARVAVGLSTLSAAA